MKEWPKEKTETLDYEALIKPVRAALMQAYKFTRSKLKSIPYDGYNFGGQTLCCIGTPEYELNKESIKYHKERGRDVLDIILMIAFNLGLENGRRIEAKNTKHFEHLYESYKALLDASKFCDRQPMSGDDWKCCFEKGHSGDCETEHGRVFNSIKKALK